MSELIQEPVSVVVSHVVRANQKLVIEPLLKSIRVASAKFEGYLGSNILIEDQGEKCEYHIIYRFVDTKKLMQWYKSDERRFWLEKIDKLCEKTRRQHLTGLETWFSLNGSRAIIPPPRYKIALVTWVCVYVLLLIIFGAAGGFLNTLVMPLKFFLVSLTVVLSLTYLIMPNVTRLLAAWLYPKGQ